MKVKFKCGELRNLLNSTAVYKGHIIPIRQYVKLDVRDDGAFLTGATENVFVRANIQPEEAKFGSMLLLPSVINNGLKFCDKDEIVTLILETSDRVGVYYNNSYFGLATINSNQYPELNFDFVPDVRVETALILRGIRLLKYNVPNEEDKPFLNGILFDDVPETGLSFVAGNTKLMSRLSIPDDNVGNFDAKDLNDDEFNRVRFLFHSDAIPLLEKLDGDYTEIGKNGNVIMVRSGSFVFGYTPPEINYPDWCPPFKHYAGLFTESVIYDVESLRNAMGRSLVVKNKYARCDLNITPEITHISTKSELGEYTDTLPAVATKEKIISLNANFVIKVLDNCVGEKIKFQYDDKNHVVLVTDMEANVQTIIMGMR